MFTIAFVACLALDPPSTLAQPKPAVKNESPMPERPLQPLGPHWVRDDKYTACIARAVDRCVKKGEIVDEEHGLAEPSPVKLTCGTNRFADYQHKKCVPLGKDIANDAKKYCETELTKRFPNLCMREVLSAEEVRAEIRLLRQQIYRLCNALNAPDEACPRIMDPVSTE